MFEVEYVLLHYSPVEIKERCFCKDVTDILSVVGHAIRLFTVNWKNLLHYSRESGVSVAATYLTVIENAKMYGLEVRDYFVHVLRKLVSVETDIILFI